MLSPMHAEACLRMSLDDAEACLCMSLDDAEACLCMSLDDSLILEPLQVRLRDNRVHVKWNMHACCVCF